jgi:branched-chain amino acid transport system permease protein
MREFLEQVIAGIAAGGIYASLALALVLIYRAMGLINFAQGEFAMFTAFICWALLQGPQVPFALALAISVGLGFVGALDAAVIGVSLLTLALLYLLFNRTKLGLAMRAAAQYPEVSELLGVRTGLMLGLGWGLASAVGAISGILVAPRILLEPNMMQSVIIYAFAAAVMGGIDSPLGAVVGGLALGVMLALIGAYVPALADLRLALSLLLIVVLLVVRPSGLFGQHQARRV